MQMIREHDNRVDAERMPCADRPKRCTQSSDVVDETPGSAFSQVDGEEPRAACREIATILRH
jgi:hypothetical protein